MRPLEDTYPRAAPWINASISSVLYALVVWLVTDDSLASHTLGIIAIGVGAFVTTILARRRTESRRKGNGS